MIPGLVRLSLDVRGPQWQQRWHDAIAIAARWPVGMLFVRCEGGISHHPDEAATACDVALTIQAYCRAVDIRD